MDAPLVSVVIPIFNPPDEFLREAVASVEAQHYRPLEVILVNDGSDAHTVALAKTLASGAGIETRFLEHPGGVNRGLSATRNRGAASANGEYLAFLDADDVWVDSKVAAQVRMLRGDPELALVFGLTRYWYSWRQGANRQVEDFVVARGVDSATVMPPCDFVSRFLRGRIIVPSASNTMMRRDAFMRCGGFEESFRGMYEDQAFLVKLGLDATVAAVPECWDWYRQHADSMTARADRLGSEHEARRIFLEWVRRYCLERRIFAPEVWEAVNKELWLAEAATSGASPSRLIGRLKRWGLRLEEAVVPGPVRSRVWGRPRSP